MNCQHCGAEPPPGSAFCNACGGRLEVSCAACGNTPPPDSAFCNGCGANLEADAPPAAARRVPRDYTPKHLADKILQSQSALEGERKQVSVLFADVKGSMDLAEQLGPELWHEVLDRFFQILAEGVHRFEGTVNQYTGDGIMALFGAPIAHEDHAHRAGYAALHLQDELREFARDIKRRHGVDFAVRIGIHSGDVVVGKIGDDLRMDYTAQGHTVGLAQRMESLAASGCTYLSSATEQMIRGYFELEDLGEFEIKGSPEPLQVYELQGIGAARTRFDVSRARGLTRFVGRGNETALLETSLAQGLAGPTRTIGVVAQAGTGKSRLCYEFLESCRARGITVFEARGLSHGMNIPLLPMLELMRGFYGIQDQDSDRVAREKIAGRTLLLDASLHDELPIVFDLLGVPDPSRPMPDIDPDALKRRMYSTLRKIVRADSALDPGVMLVEDLHWLDPASDEMLEQMIEALSESRGLLLVNFRPEYRARWMQQSHYQQLSLLPLPEDALTELLADLLGSDPSVARLPAAIYERTGGNPFYIEEFVLSLVDSGHLQGSRGDYRLATEFEGLPMPDSVKALLAARIDRLLEREKQVLQTASVIGKTFPESILSRVVELPEADLADAVRRLQDCEFLYEAALYPEREYSFKHPLTQEVAEESQLAARRTEAHAAVGRAYEALFPDHLDERAALLAHHWESADQPLLAARWHARAADRIATTNFQGSVDHWSRVDALLPDEGGNAETDELKGRTFGELLVRGFRTGLGADSAAEIVERARRFHEPRGNEGQLASCLSYYAAILQSAGKLRAYYEMTGEAIGIVERLGDVRRRVGMGLDWIYSSLLCGQLEAALAAADETIELAKGDADLAAEDAGYSPLTVCTAFSAMPLALLGRLDEAQSRVDDARRLATDRESAETSTWLDSVETELLRCRGEDPESIRVARRAIRSADRSGSLFDAAASRAWLAAAHAEAGQWEDALLAMDAAIERSDHRRIGADTLLFSGWAVPAAHLGLGDLEKARSTVQKCIEECRDERCLVSLCRAHLVSAAIHRGAIAGGDPQSSETDVEADLAEAESLVLQTGSGRLRGMLLEARGQREEALQLYAEMGATGHVARIEGQLRG